MFKRLLMVLTIIFISCSQKKEDPIFKVATNAEYPPFEYIENNNFKGIDIDIMALIAEKLKIKYEIVDTDFDEIIPKLVSGKVDIGISAITITPRRGEMVYFTSPYYKANQSFIVKSESDIKILKADDIVKYRVGVQNGTTGQIYIDENYINKDLMDRDKLIKFVNNDVAITALISGEIDLVIMDDTAAGGYEKIKPIKTAYTIATGEEYGIALKKNSPHKEKIENALKEIISSGDLNKIILKHQ